MGIEPTKPLLAQSFIGFEDRGRHQSGTHFHTRGYYCRGMPATDWKEDIAADDGSRTSSVRR